MRPHFAFVAFGVLLTSPAAALDLPARKRVCGK